MRALWLLPLLVLTACAAQPAGGSGAAPATSAGAVDVSNRARDDLQVVIDRGNRTGRERFTLVCGTVPGGTHPDARAACAHLATLKDPFAPIPADAVCTQIYGGPQTARVTGVWRGRPVDLSLSRVDGCRIAQWDKLGPLLPGPVGVPN